MQRRFNVTSDSMESPKDYRYIVLLRGINVGGNSIIKMAELKKLFESLGFTNVVTYVQSGNVLFDAKEKNVSLIALQIEKMLASKAKLSIRAFVLTVAQLKKAVKQNPFHPEKHEKEGQCILMFLSAKPDKESSKALMDMQGDDYRFFIYDKVLYYTYSRALEGKRRTVNFEKVLRVSGTARTWKVVSKLIGLAKLW